MIREDDAREKLKVGTTKCKACKTKLHYKQVCGIVTKEEAPDGKLYYDTQCPSCGAGYLVRAS